MTDLNKLRSEFEAVTETYHCIYNADLDYYFSGSKFVSDKAEIEVNAGWKAWKKAKAQTVPEGYALVSKDKLHEWYCMANRSEELGCPECYESRGYAHNLACELNEASESGAEG
ncbi:TPA: hypothetical protein ACVB6C_000403 [Acinetobacter baumannii]